LGIKTEHYSALTSKNLLAADGQTLTVKGQIQATISLKGLLVPHSFVVIQGLNYNVILGIEFLKDTHCKLDLDYGVASFYDDLVLLPMYGKPRNQNVVRALDSVAIPAATEAIIKVTVSRKFRARTALIEPDVMNTQRSFLVAKALVNLKGRQTVSRLCNRNDEQCKIKKGKILATINDATEMLIPSTSNMKPNTKAERVKRTNVSREKN